jgi:hypothetical protein
MPDHIAQQFVDWLTSRSGDDFQRYLYLFVTLYAAYMLMRWFIRRFAPWLLARVVGPLVAAALVAVCVLVVAGQTLLVLPFRGARMRPPGVVFSMGDVATAGARRAISAVPLWAAGTAFLHQVPRIVILVILVTVGWWGHEFVCQQSPQSSWCGDPVAAVNTIGDDVWDRGVMIVQNVFS